MAKRKSERERGREGIENDLTILTQVVGTLAGWVRVVEMGLDGLG